MSIVRQDAWTNDEDLVLAEVVLRHIREGSTQLLAFEEVGERLSRTAAACGFRWNSAIRKKYESAIAIAKKQRKKLKKSKFEDTPTPEPLAASQEIANEILVNLDDVEEKQGTATPNDLITFEAVIDFLHSQKQALSTNRQSIKENEILKEKIEELEKENKQLSLAYLELKENYTIIKEDYKTLIEIMNRAKQLADTNHA